LSGVDADEVSDCGSSLFLVYKSIFINSSPSQSAGTGLRYFRRIHRSTSQLCTSPASLSLPRNNKH